MWFCLFFENPASSFHLLFDVDQTWAQDKLQIALRTLQDAPRCPTASNMGPTWGPRGLLDRSKGGQIAFPRGSPAEIALRQPTWTPHGPQMNPKLGSSWDHLGVILGASWCHLGVILGSLWDHFEVTLGSHWGHFGVILAPFWYQRFSPKCCGADFGSRIKISGHLLGKEYTEFRALPVPTGPGRLKRAGGRGRSP